MSLRNRARRIQRATGLTYQQALSRLRALGAAPAELRDRTGWPLWKCELYLVDPELVDPEIARAAPAAPSSIGADAIAHAARRIAIAIDADARRPRDADEPAAVCRWLLEMTAARAVWLLGARGERLVEIAPGQRSAVLALLAQRCSGAAGRYVPPRQPLLLALGDYSIYVAPVIGGRAVAVRFDATTSLGLVRLRTRRAVAELDAIFRRGSAAHGPPPGGSGSGPGAAPAEAFVWRDARDEDPT